MTSLGTGRQRLGDRYELQGLIATGGMGQVWRACDRLLERPVAVKVLRSEYADDPVFLERFRCEARHAAALSHPNVAAVLDYGETRDAASGESLAYLVMELVEGAPLSARLESGGPLPPEAALSVLRQTAAGLAEAHRAGMVHRDVKPANILVRPDGRVKLTDFGIAWSAESVPLTRTGQVVGTAQYMSPEQATGERVGPATDVYALGLVGYESLTGRPAFAGTNPVAVALKQLREDPEPLPEDLPPHVRELIGAALVKDPRERPSDAAAFLAAVEETIEATATPQTRPRPVLPPPVLPAPGGPSGPRGERTAAPGPAGDRGTGGARRRALLACAAAVLAGLLAVLLWPGGSGGGTTPAARADEPAASAPASPPASGTAPGSSAGSGTVVLAAGDHLGRPVAEVAGELSALGLTVDRETEETTAVRPGTVAGLDPVGVPLPPGAAVTIRVAAAPAGQAPTAPQDTAPQEAAPQEAAPPAPSDPTPAEPAPSEAAPSEAAPAEPAPSDAAPAEPAPAEPAPSDAAPAEPAPAEPAPAEPAPSDAAPAEPAPAEPAPSEPVPSDAAPSDAAPSDAPPSGPAPAESAPAESPAGSPAPEEAAPASGSSAPAPPEPGPAG